MLARLRHSFPLIALTLLLGAAWTVADWMRLSHLLLPDTDDAMRLQQVRDWIGGQATGNTAQHRLAGGLAMHWSRIPDLGPATIILLLRPLSGPMAAEVAAVVVWPLMQFAALLAMVRAIAGQVAPRAAGTAMVLAALSYPASALFLPGRIDHHALQLLLVLVQLRALLAPASFGAGTVAGFAAATGAAIGLETLPFAMLSGGIVTLGWLRGDGGTRQTGFGLALGVGLLALIPLSAHGGTCDTIRPLVPAAVAGAFALAALGRIEHHRIAFLTATAAALAILAWPAARPCLDGPYATVDPLVARLWLSHVGEAQPLFMAGPAQAIAYAGLLAAGLTTGAWLARRRGGPWPILLGYLALSAAITLAQLRGAHVGAAIAVVPLAVLLAEARARARTQQVLALWVAGAGLSYPLAAGVLAPKVAIAGPTRSALAECDDQRVIERLRTLPPGRVMAGIDLGAYVIAGTPHAAIAAPYHRNNAGNSAMYRFFLRSPDAARRIAREWRVDYVVLCRGAFGPVDIPPGSIAAGTRPAWLRPVADANAVPAIFTIDRRLSDALRPR